MRTLIALLIFTFAASAIVASDHLDTPTVIADPAADIGDLYAWMSPDGKRLNLVMTLVAHKFSDRLEYVFHVDSGSRFGETKATTSIACRFDAANAVDCRTGGKFRVYAGLRDDPFFNNVRGTRAALNAAAAVLAKASKDAAGCPVFDAATSRAILDLWRHTDGGPAKNTLENWKSAALVVSIDLDAVNAGGKLLAVWAGVYKSGARIERIGRPLTGNALIGLFAPDEVSDARKEIYNAAAQKDWPQFADDIERSLARYDAFDGTCGNQWMAGRGADRYRALAKVLADDRLWINSTSATCKQFFAVELAEVADVAETAISGSAANDCGGRTPNYDAPDVFRSLLANGSTAGVSDGISRDDHEHSTSEFPFLAAPSRDVATTSSSIAIENLDAQIARCSDDCVELLLLRSRFLGDRDALDRAIAIAETSRDRSQRARAHAAVHRFEDALSETDDAVLRASILVEMGRADEVIPELEARVARDPDFASQSALALAYAATERFADADRLWAAALDDLDTTSPFPYAWTYFARGVMWAERAGDPARGQALYRQALAVMPEFVAAKTHLKELE